MIFRWRSEESELGGQVQPSLGKRAVAEFAQPELWAVFQPSLGAGDVPQHLAEPQIWQAGCPSGGETTSEIGELGF